MITPVKTAYGKAHEMIWKMGYWRYLLLPILFSVVFAVFLLGFCGLLSYAAGGWIENYFYQDQAAPSWIRPLAIAFIFILSLGPCYILFRNLVLLCYGPFLNRLSRKAEEWLLGEAKAEDTPLGVSLKRLLFMAFITVSLSLATMLIGLALGWIPVIGWVIAVLLFPIQMFLSSLSFIDPYLERRGYKAGASLKLMWKNKQSVFVFGLVGFVINLVPIVGWFVGPTYAVVAGIVFGIFMVKSEGG